MEEQKRPGVGLSLILMNLEKNEVLLGKRKNSHGAGTWAFPGGHLEKFESFAGCIVREMEEETGLLSGINYRLFYINPNEIPMTNDFFYKENKHYITLYFRAKYVQGEPKVMEPDKLSAWRWFKWDKFPDNLFICLKNLLKQDYNPFK